MFSKKFGYQTKCDRPASPLVPKDLMREMLIKTKTLFCLNDKYKLHLITEEFKMYYILGFSQTSRHSKVQNISVYWFPSASLNLAHWFPSHHFSSSRIKTFILFAQIVINHIFRQIFSDPVC